MKNKLKKLKTNLFLKIILHYCTAQCVLPTLLHSYPSFFYIFMTLYHSLYLCVCVTSYRQKCHYVYHFSLLMCNMDDVHSHAKLTQKRKGSEGKGAKQRNKKNAKEVFVDVIYFRRRLQVLFYILYSETVMLFISVHYLWKNKFTTQFFISKILYYIRIELLNKRWTSCISHSPVLFPLSFYSRREHNTTHLLISLSCEL